jgi:hypothetical protein
MSDVIGQETIESAISAYSSASATNFDKYGRRVFDRLKGDPRVPETLAAITQNDIETGALLRACVEADLLMRTFNERVARERKTPERLNRFKQGIADLRKFLTEFSRPTDPLEAWAVLSDAEILKHQNALDDLELIVETRRLVASQTMLRFGATRKSSKTNKQAAERAAIGWIADAVKHVARRPLARHAAILAEAALGVRDIDFDRARKALKTRARLMKTRANLMK